VQIHEFTSELDKDEPEGLLVRVDLLSPCSARTTSTWRAGILLELWLVGRLLGGMTNYRFIALRAIALYWY
jgi:hypothetical protein